ncbi:MAG: methionyl-tRNA formyltransferase, partial [Candidatus Peregrinibacteria bacterium]
YRGASPIQSALLSGERQTGISVMQMAEKMDAGPVYKTFSIPIEPEDNASTLHDKLAELTAQKTPDVLVSIAEGKLKAKPQNEEKVTFSKKLSKADGKIDWNEDAVTIVKKIRAYWGWPGSYTAFKGQHLKILAGKASKEKSGTGMVFEKSGKILMGTGQDSLELITVQLEGKKAMPIQEFIQGHPDFMGTKLGENN